MTTILGISAYHHDSAAALVVDGEILAAAQEERFTRIKHDHGFPGNAISYCLDEAGIEAGELAYVGFYDKPFLNRDNRERRRSRIVFPSVLRCEMVDDKNSKTEFEREAEAPQQGPPAEFFHFLLNNKKWWLTPIIVVLMLVALLIVLSGSAAAPFIYTLF